MLRWHGYADFIVEKGKGLFSHENKPFYTPFGGDKRDRTADLLNAIQALSQLSYTPDSFRLSLEARVILSDGRAFVKGVLEIFLEKSKYSTCHVVKGVFHVAGGAVNAPADLLLLGF